MSTSLSHRAQQPATAPLVEIVVTEELTAPAAARLHVLLTDALALHPTQLVINLAACPRADALAVDVLLNAHRRAFHLGIRLVLRAPSERLRQVLGLSHLDRVFNIDTQSSSNPLPEPRSPGAAGPAGEER